MLTTATVQAAYASIRSALPCALMTVLHVASGASYQGVRVSLGSDQVLRHGNDMQTAASGVRLNVSELKQPFPQAGDTIRVTEQSGGETVDRVVTDMRYDQARATVLMSYGAKYG